MTPTRPRDEDQPYQLERRTVVLLGLGMVALMVLGITVPAIFGGSPCADVAAVAAQDAEQRPVDEPADRPDRGIRAFAAGSQVLVARVVAAPSTQVDALQRVDAAGERVGECLDLAVISELPAFLLAADSEATVLLRADGEERTVELRGPAGALRWEADLEVPAGAPGGIAVETSARLTPSTVALELPADADPSHVTLDRSTGDRVTPAEDG